LISYVEATQKTIREDVKTTYRALTGEELPDAPDVGGINLDPTLWNLETQGQAEALEIPFDLPRNVEELNNFPAIEGFTPVIHQIIPVKNIYQLIGIEKIEGPADQLSQLTK
ncbi:MAG: hypothetical protein NUV91_10525, partial [Candidatus Omnitrophica bacterium]|nr:hypothetical protein [Candidatus Omnitrophota bacterium]